MSTTALEDVAWDLEPLVDGDGAAGADRQLAEAQQRADAFAAAHAGKVAALDGPGLAAAMDELAVIYELVGRAGSYASLRFSTDTADPANGALLQRVQEHGTAIETTLLFFDLEWAALDDERAEELLAADGLDHYRHHLRTRAQVPPAPALRARGEGRRREGASPGRDAWTRLFSELTSALEVDLPGRRAARRARRRARAPDVPRPRGAPQHGQEAVTARAAARPAHARLHLQHARCTTRPSRTACGRFPTWLSSRNLANEASDESVQALVEAVKDAYELPRRWYRAQGAPARHRPPRGLRPDGVGRRGRRGGRLGRGAGHRPRAPTTTSPPCSATRRRASSTAATSTRPSGRPSAAARSAPTPSRARTPTSC